MPPPGVPPPHSSASPRVSGLWISLRKGVNIQLYKTMEGPACPWQGAPPKKGLFWGSRDWKEVGIAGCSPGGRKAVGGREASRPSAACPDFMQLSGRRNRGTRRGSGRL